MQSRRQNPSCSWKSSFDQRKQLGFGIAFWGHRVDQPAGLARQQLINEVERLKEPSSSVTTSSRRLARAEDILFTRGSGRGDAGESSPRTGPAREAGRHPITGE